VDGSAVPLGYELLTHLRGRGQFVSAERSSAWSTAACSGRRCLRSTILTSW